MTNIETQKKKLQQKKNRIAIEETRLRLKERKARTRHLIKNGGLIAKAGLDHFPTNALYGALISLKQQLDNNQQIMAAWVIKGDKAFNKEQKNSTPVILKFAAEPIKEVRNSIRSLGMRFNRFRSEWYGNVHNIAELKTCISEYKHNLEVLEEEI